jgi:hypothetical protein
MEVLWNWKGHFNGIVSLKWKGLFHGIVSWKWKGHELMTGSAACICYTEAPTLL